MTKYDEILRRRGMSESRNRNIKTNTDVSHFDTLISYTSFRPKVIDRRRVINAQLRDVARCDWLPPRSLVARAPGVAL